MTVGELKGRLKDKEDWMKVELANGSYNVEFDGTIDTINDDTDVIGIEFGVSVDEV